MSCIFCFIVRIQEKVIRYGFSILKMYIALLFFTDDYFVGPCAVPPVRKVCAGRWEVIRLRVLLVFAPFKLT